MGQRTAGMRVFFYDATFEGLLSAIFDAYTHKAFPDALLRHGAIPPLQTADAHSVATQTEKAERVLRALEKKLPGPAFGNLLYASLADMDEHGMALFRYIRKMFDTPGPAERNLADPDILALTELASKVGRERQHLLGFVRFQKTAGEIYFAAFEPRYNVLPLMLPHFIDRFRDQQWILYDARRQYGVFFDKQQCREMHMDPKLIRNGSLDPALLAQGEEDWQWLWKKYCAAAAIKERLNPVLQRRCMPRRFWKYLPEKQ